MFSIPRFFIAFFIFCPFICMAQMIEVNKDIQVKKLSDKVYLYTAWTELGSWGRVGSNGLIVVDGGKAFLIDSPMHEEQTLILANWIKSALKANIESFVPGHWHDDCIGGLDYLNKQGVKTYAGKRTNDILKTKGLAEAKYSFTDSVSLHLNNIEIQCYYLGGGHAKDNIVMWIPSEKILFGGCQLKDVAANGLGNTADASPLEEWFETVCKVEAKFPQAEIIVPGHGELGGSEILRQTKSVLTKNMKSYYNVKGDTSQK